MSVFSFSRRSFLRKSGALVLFGLSARGLSAAETASPYRAFPLASLSDPVLGDPQIAHQIGKHYLRNHPQECGQQILERILLPQAADEAVSEHPGQELQKARARDYERGNTVIADGWVISRTEARLCGLHYLTAIA